MASPPNRATVWFPDNSVTVDIGTGIDVRQLDDAADAADSSQNATATHTQDGAIRTFDPATTGVTANTDVLAVFQNLGWAIPVAEFTPADSRCQTRLPAGDATLRASMTVARSTVPLADTTGVTLRASLWKFNPTTNTGVFIASASSLATTFELVLNASVSKSLSLTMTWASDVIFAASEILYLQIGVGCGTMGNPLTGTTTYTFTLVVGDAGRDLTLNTEPLNVKCEQSNASAVALNGAKDTIASRRRTLTSALTLNAAFEDQLIIHRQRSAGLALNAAFNSLSQLRRAFTAGLTLNAQRAIRRVKLKAKLGNLTLNAAHDKNLVLRRQRSAQLLLNADISTTLKVRKIANLALNATYTRFLRLQRIAVAQLSLAGKFFVTLPQNVLSRMSGGAITIIRKIFPSGD